jgi:Patatin-like phospholipase
MSNQAREIDNGNELPERLRLSSTLLSILLELSDKEEEELRRLLRPHDDAGFVSAVDGNIMLLRRRLDEALDGLTKLEIACQLGLYGLNSTGMEAYVTKLAPGWSNLIQSDAFLRYLGAYLYFGVRILAGRIAPPSWWTKQEESAVQNCETDTPFVNKRPLQLAVPPVVGNATENEQSLKRFLDLRASVDQTCDETLKFLDGFHGDQEMDQVKAEVFDYDEPAEFELWLRGLRPGLEPARAARFARLKEGLIAWARTRADFYMSLEPPDQNWDVFGEVGERRRPRDGWMISNPAAARIALSDFYWLAKLLRAEVSANGKVTYQKPSWMHVLHFEAILHKQDKAAKPLRDEEEVLRSVFDYVCDLVLNAVELSEKWERSLFQPEEYPEPQGQVEQWRTVFDKELREIGRQKNRREYRKPEETDKPGEKAEVGPEAGGARDGDANSRQKNNPGINGREKRDDDRTGWSERFWTRRDTRHRIGLAFSGGGIRSATFNLGVLQGLQELDLLRHVDYLSTVSGGGFIGSWLVGNVRRTRHWLGRLTCWDESIAHLRSYSNYLAPLTGILSPDTWTLGLSWVRNAFLVQLSGLTWLFVILTAVLLALKGFLFAADSFPSSGVHFDVLVGLQTARGFSCSGCLSYLGIASGVAALLVTVCLAYNFAANRAETGRDAPRAFLVRWSTVIPSWIGSFLLASILWSSKWDVSPKPGIETFGDYSKILERMVFRLPWIFVFHWLAMVGVGWIALTPARRAAGVQPIRFRRWKGLTPAILMSLACVAVLYLELCGVVYLFLMLKKDPTHFGPYAFVFGPSLVLLAFTVSVIVWIGLSGKMTNDAQREWWTRFGAWLTMFSVVSLVLAAVAVFGPRLVILVFHDQDPAKPHGSLFNTIKWTSVVSWLGTVVGGLLAGKSSKTGDRSSRKSVPLDLLAKVGGFLFILAFAVAAATTLYLFLMVWYNKSLSTCYWEVLQKVQSAILWGTLAVVLACGLVFSWFFDINIFGLSRFYQYRLVRCYLGATRWKPGLRKPHPFTRFDHKDDLCLSELKGDYAGPYPILNCTLNLAGSSDLALNTRHSASFSLTPMYCGADRPKVGYVPTGEPGVAAGSFSGGARLGQAAAISGAAASPNMGYNTSPVVAFLMTMFNVRLGWWFPNPGKRAWNEQGLRFSLYYMTRELLGIADEGRQFLNVSDGGHFENLAIYELIRRRCKVIIACDAECDELLQFGGLGNVLRISGTDFGAQIDLDVKSIRTQKQGHSLADSAVGKIKYDNGSIGYLVYLKASITGDEDASVAQYRASHPSFPHETTADQFFSEDQFESYRKLGLHVVKRSFRGTQLGRQPFEVAERMYDTLAPAGCSSETFLKHTQTLERIWAEFRESPKLNTFLQELMLGPVPAAPALVLTDEELCMGLELIQLMEEVFLDLQLEDFWEHPDNRGWAIMFMRWARSPRFQQTWKDARRTYGIRFEYFCAARLGLERDKPIVRV